MSQDQAATELRETVRRRYAEAAATVTAGGSGCCGGEAATTLEPDDRFGPALYGATDKDNLPVAAVAASLGCGNPTAVADLHAGERVLDLGSGGGIDVILSSDRVGSAGHVYGVDMTIEMIELAQANAVQAGVRNVEFLQGTIENVPLPDAAVDVVISNCVINLSADKPAVIAEMFRVLAPGGRIGISDVVAEDHLTPEQRAQRGEFVGCIAGALSQQEYLDGLASAGFVDATVRFTHPVAEQMHSAIIRATKPGRVIDVAASTPQAGEPVEQPTCCSTSEAAACCAPEAKAGCCRTEPSAAETAAPPASCGCR